MKTTIAAFLLCASFTHLFAADGKLAPEIQAKIDEQKKAVAEWAAEPAIIAAVHQQNKLGPLPGMTNEKWKALAPTDPAVQALQTNEAGVWLTTKLKKSDGLLTEAFLSGAKGEKVAFVEKPSNYSHAKNAKFEEPMSGKTWQGEAEMDESAKTYEVQIAVPVLDEGKPIGVLVVGISGTKLGLK